MTTPLHLDLNDAPLAPPADKLGDRLPLRILTADDISTNRQAMKFMCRHLGYETDLVDSGLEVLALLKQHAYDLIFLDIQMPVLDGIATAKEICRMIPTVANRPKLVAVTASAENQVRNRCFAAGMSDLLPKPVLPQHLKVCIERLFLNSPVASRPRVPAYAGNVSAAPWVDEVHLRAATEGISLPEAMECINDLRLSVTSDYNSIRPRIVAACAGQDAEQLAALVHGLKGCTLLIGWGRFSERCTSVLEALSEGQFDAWATLPRELDILFQASTTALQISFRLPL